MTKPPLTILYTFRRCPYAMRARMALWQSGMSLEIREILLKDKPVSMLKYSPKGTVPVLVSPSGKVIDESRDIMQWALQQNDNAGWLRPEQNDSIEKLLDENDFQFKRNLDLYKYSVRHPEESLETYRDNGLQFLLTLEKRLKERPFLIDEKISLADIGIFPFVRQFAHVDKLWFEQVDCPNLQLWLEYFLNSDLFKAIMQKFPLWQPQDYVVHQS